MDMDLVVVVAGSIHLPEDWGSFQNAQLFIYNKQTNTGDSSRDRNIAIQTYNTILLVGNKFLGIFKKSMETHPDAGTAQSSCSCLQDLVLERFFYFRG